MVDRNRTLWEYELVSAAADDLDGHGIGSGRSFPGCRENDFCLVPQNRTSFRQRCADSFDVAGGGDQCRDNGDTGYPVSLADCFSDVRNSGLIVGNPVPELVSRPARESAGP